MIERNYTQQDAMAYANKVHDALMSGMRPAPKQLPMCLHSFLSYVNYRNNCYRMTREYKENGHNWECIPFAYERYMSLIYSDMERY